MLTALYLTIVLPLFGIELPFTKTMIVLTFVAFAAIAYLIVIQKLEYLLNARIIGSQIRARAWEMLLAMLIMESAFGIPGIIAAPIYYAYMKSELREKGLV